MKCKVLTIRFVLAVLLASLLVVPLAGPAGAQEPPTQDEVRAAIADGIAWLASQQADDGRWGGWEQCAVTALAVKKLEHHAVDRVWGLGLPSPFDDANPYRENIEKGLAWLFDHCAYTRDIWGQDTGNPDSDGDGTGVYFEDPESGVYHRSYTTGIMLMALCEAVDLDREVEGGPLAGWAYEEVAEDTMDYLAWGQMDPQDGDSRGGWGYAGSDNGIHEREDWDRSDNSNAGWVTLGLGFAEAPWPEGCGFSLPQFVKDELNVWIDYIQDDVNGDDNDGGSGYDYPDSWVNILKTGNLLQQMALVGDTATTGRVLDALNYMARHWDDANDDPGWRGWPEGSVNCHATFTAMKGFTSLGLYHEFGEPSITWQSDFETVLLEQQNEDGFWPWCNWGDDILCTTWALLTLQKVAPPPTAPVDIKPTSCPNPINVKSQGVLPVAVLGTDAFDAGQVDPASVRLEGVAPLRWALEDVATPFEPFVGKEDAYDCTEAGPDGYMDLVLHFDTQQVVVALGEVSDGDVLVLSLTGDLMEEGSFVGEDVVVILKKGK